MALPHFVGEASRVRDEQRHEAILSSIGCAMKAAPLAVRLAVQQKRLDRQSCA